MSVSQAHRYPGNGAGALASLRKAALNLLRLGGFQSIRDGMQAVMHDVTALLAMAMRQPEHKTCWHFESGLGNPAAAPECEQHGGAKLVPRPA